MQACWLNGCPRDQLENCSNVLHQPEPVLGIFDGGYAQAKVVQPCLGVANSGAKSVENSRRIEILTRPRHDARLYKLLTPAKPGPRRRGRPRKWGQRLPSPSQHGKWHVRWMQGSACVYGQTRQFRCKSIDCCWAVSGPSVTVRVFVFEVEGYSKPWFIVTSALDLSAAQVLEAYAARFRQEDAIRDHKQRLGMQEVRAWTKAPVLRTFMIQQLSMTLMRLLAWQWEQQRGTDWCPPPPWNKSKTRASLLDVRRLLWRQRPVFSQFLQEMDEVKKKTRPLAKSPQPHPAQSEKS